MYVPYESIALIAWNFSALQEQKALEQSLITTRVERYDANHLLIAAFT